MNRRLGHDRRLSVALDRLPWREIVHDRLALDRNGFARAGDSWFVIGGETLMSALSILVRLDRAREVDTAAAKRRLSAVGQPEQVVTKVNVVEGEEDGGYINVTYSSDDLQALWSLVRSELAGNGTHVPSLMGCTIVVCTGQFGWDDYLLLHHFDPSQPLDAVASAEPAAAPKQAR
jgi:hypothetical protein